MIRHFVDHRHEVVTRRTRYELEEARKRAHILEGLLIALDHLDEVINLIRSSRTPDDAHTGLMTAFALSDLQAKAILDLRLQRLTGLERDKIQDQYNELMEKINYYEAVLADEGLRMTIIKTELDEVREKFGDKRRTAITLSDGEIRMEDIIANDDMMITISHEGYIKRTPVVDFKVQGRGGKGHKGAATKNADFVEHLFTARNHNYMLFFTEKGKCYWIKVYEIPPGERTHKGRAIQNLIQIDRDDKVKAYLTVESLDEEAVKDRYVIMTTRKGTVKKTELAAYSRPRNGGINAIGINEGDELISADLTNGTSQVVLALRSGAACRFGEEKVRDMGRTATGVRGITLDADNDEVIGMVIVPNDEVNLLVISENGYGKQTPVSEYRLTNRGGKGVRAMNVTEKTGRLVAIMPVTAGEHLMIITRNGLTVRLSIDSISTTGRATQGVRLIRLNGDDAIASVTKVIADEEEDEVVVGVDGEVLDVTDADVTGIDAAEATAEADETPTTE